MPETVLYMRGQFPFAFDQTVLPSIIRDAILMLELTPDQLQNVSHDIESFPGFLDGTSLEHITAVHVSNKVQSQRLATLITGLTSVLRGTGERPDAFLKKVDAWLQPEGNRQQIGLSPEAADELRRRLPLVARRYPSLERQAKAQRLAEATGLRLENIQLICDIRPIFDVPHAVVEGLIPYTTLKIVCKGVDGLPVTMEALLSHADVNDLASKASDAQKKLKVIRSLLAEKALLVPTVDLTKMNPQTAPQGE